MSDIWSKLLEDLIYSCKNEQPIVLSVIVGNCCSFDHVFIPEEICEDTENYEHVIVMRSGALEITINKDLLLTRMNKEYYVEHGNSVFCISFC